MKNAKIILLVLVAMAFGQLGQAQFGIRGGFVATDQNVTIADIADLNPKSKLGVDIGVVYNLDISPGLSFQPELHYTQMGWKVDAFIFDLRANFDYIRVPLLFKYDVMSNNENIKLSPFAGPYVSFLANQDVDLLRAINYDIPFKNLDVGADVGVMVQLKSGLFFDVRYMLGFSNITDLDIVGVSVGDVKNRGFGAGMGYMF